jgi:hypothetical protein
MNYIRTWKSEDLANHDYYDIYSINKVCDGNRAYHKDYIWKEYIPEFGEVVKTV